MTTVKTKTKVILTGDFWKRDPGVTFGKAYDVIEISVNNHPMFHNDRGENNYAYPNDNPSDEYSLAVDVIEWPLPNVGDKIRATLGENVLIGTVINDPEIDNDLEYEADTIAFEVDGDTSENNVWYIEPSSGWTVEITPAKPDPLKPGLYTVAGGTGLLWLPLGSDRNGQYTYKTGEFISQSANDIKQKRGSWNPELLFEFEDEALPF